MGQLLERLAGKTAFCKCQALPVSPSGADTPPTRQHADARHQENAWHMVGRRQLELLNVLFP